MLSAKRDPEPVLPELLRDAWRRGGRLARAALVLVVLAAIAVAAWILFGRGGESFTHEGGDGAAPFSVSWGPELERIPGNEIDILRLASPGIEAGEGVYFAVQPFPENAVEAAREDEPLPGIAIAAKPNAHRDDPRIVLEGRTELAVDRGPEAYQTAVTGRDADGNFFIGKRFLVPDPDSPGEGVTIEIGEVTSNERVAEKVAEAPAGFFLNWPIQLLLEDAASVRTAEGLEEPLRSFAFG